MYYGFHPSAFGTALVMATERGLCGPRLLRPWRGACVARRHAPPLAPRDLCRGFRAHRAALRPHLRQEQVAAGSAAARGVDRNRLRGAGLGDADENPDGPRHDLFGHREQPSASPRRRRAVGAAVGKNPISFVVPCHRVLGKSGELTGYHWGLTRKRAMLGWEAGRWRRRAPLSRPGRAKRDPGPSFTEQEAGSRIARRLRRRLCGTRDCSSPHRPLSTRR